MPQSPIESAVPTSAARWRRRGAALLLVLTLIALALGSRTAGSRAASGTDIGSNSAPATIGCIFCDGHGRSLPPQTPGAVYVDCTPAFFQPGCGETLAQRPEPAGTLRNLTITQSGQSGGYNNYAVVVNGVNTGIRCNVYPPYDNAATPGCSDLTDSFVIHAGDLVELSIGDPGYAFNPGNFSVSWSLELDPSFVVATDKDQCKDGGWQNVRRADGTPFKNQGDCIQYVNTGK